MGKIRKRKTKQAPINLDSDTIKKLKTDETDNIEDYVFDLADLPAKENNGKWRDVILPDSVLSTADLGGLGMFEEIDGSQYDIIKARSNKNSLDEEFSKIDDEKDELAGKGEKGENKAELKEFRFSQFTEEELAAKEAKRVKQKEKIKAWKEKQKVKKEKIKLEKAKKAADKAAGVKPEDKKDDMETGEAKTEKSEKNSEETTNSDNQSKTDPDKTETSEKSEKPAKSPKNKSKKKQAAAKNAKPAETPEAPIEVSEECKIAWNSLHVPEALLPALAKFTEPTPIQKQAIPFAIRDNSDIIGCAQTGSGKTIAFGVPMVAKLMKRDVTKNQVKDFKNSEFSKFQMAANGNEYLPSLVVLPTRELAKQVTTRWFF